MSIAAYAEMEINAMAEPFEVIELPLAVLLTPWLEGQHLRPPRQVTQPGPEFFYGHPTHRALTCVPGDHGTGWSLTGSHGKGAPLACKWPIWAIVRSERLFDAPVAVVVPSPDPVRQATRDQLAQRLHEPSRADERLLPVSEAFADLLPGRGIRRGSVTVVTGSNALALALVAKINSWMAAVGLDDLGIVAAHEFGLRLERLLLVPYPGRHWADVVAIMVDAVDVVMVRPPAGASPTTLRRLAVRARERGAVLLPLGDWAQVDFRLELVRSVWLGLEQGYGRLQARQALISVTGRGAAANGQRAWLWLPDEQGRVRPLTFGDRQPR
jgi:hypothetical protein